MLNWKSNTGQVRVCFSPLFILPWITVYEQYKTENIVIYITDRLVYLKQINHIKTSSYNSYY